MINRLRLRPVPDILRRALTLGFPVLVGDLSTDRLRIILGKRYGAESRVNLIFLLQYQVISRRKSEYNATGSTPCSRLLSKLDDTDDLKRFD